MRLGLVPETRAEEEALETGQVPIPLFDTHYAFALARAVMAATKLGVFEALSGGQMTASAVASRCDTDPLATQKLLVALTGCRYLTCDNGIYGLTRIAEMLLAGDSPRSLARSVLFTFYEWGLMTQIEDYLRTGESVDIHTQMTVDQWKLYQHSMLALASQSANEVVAAIPVPSSATSMIDVGGAHGYFSAALCRRHRKLRSVVLDLPEAIKISAPLLAAENMGDKVIHCEGDATTHDFGIESYDVVLMSNLAHHLSAEQNADLVARIARALRPNGVLALIEPDQAGTTFNDGQFAALNELYFGLISQSGIWTVDDITRWQRCAGLTPHPSPIALPRGDVAIHLAVKASEND